MNFLNRGLAHSINKCRKQNKITQIASNSLSSKNNPPPTHLPFKKEHDHGLGYKAMLCLHTVYGRPNRDVRANTLQHLPRGSFPQANFQTLGWHFAFIPFSQNPWWVCWLSSLLQHILHPIEKTWGIIATGTFPGLSQCPLRTLTWWRADSSSSWVSTHKEQHPLPWWLILSEWHVYSHTPLIHSSIAGRPESLSLLSVRLVVECPQVAGSSGTNHVVHASPPSAKEPS